MWSSPWMWSILMIRVLVCDTFPILLTGLTDILRATHDLTVTGTCSKGADALALVRTQQPDIVVTNQWLADMSGLDLAKMVRDERHRTRVILLTNGLGDADAVKALRDGVRGVVTMEMPPMQIITCIRSVHAGHTWLDAPVAHRTLERMLRQDSAVQALAETLTPQEITISRLVAEGLRNREIADRLGIREGTVKLHLHHVYQKLHLRNRMALMMHAHEQALV